MQFFGIFFIELSIYYIVIISKIRKVLSYYCTNNSVCSSRNTSDVKMLEFIIKYKILKTLITAEIVLSSFIFKNRDSIFTYSMNR